MPPVPYSQPGTDPLAGIRRSRSTPRRAPCRRPDDRRTGRPRRGDRPRRDRDRRRPARRARRRGRSRPLPVDRSRRRQAVRSRRRPDVAEALDVPAACADPGRQADRRRRPVRRRGRSPRAARAHRRPRLRARRARDPGSRLPRRPGDRRRLPRPSRRDLRRRRRMRDSDVDLLLHLDGHRSRGQRRLRRRPDRARRRLRRPDRLAGRVGAHRLARPAGRRPVCARRGGRGRRRRPRGDGHPARHVECARGSRRRPGTSGLGGGRRAMPRLHELHARLPDLLLHQRRPEVRPRRDDLDRGADLGLVLHRRVREGRRRLVPAARQGPLPPVADPQVLELVGPVRVERLRRLRALHRLVPGRHRRPRGARGHRRRRAGPDAPAQDDRDGRTGARSLRSPRSRSCPPRRPPRRSAAS